MCRFLQRTKWLSSTTMLKRDLVGWQCKVKSYYQRIWIQYEKIWGKLYSSVGGFHFFFTFSSVTSVFDAFSEVSKHRLFLEWSLSENMPRDFDPWGEVICILSELSRKYLVNEVAFLSYGSLADTGNSASAGFPEKSRGLWKSKWATVRSMGFVPVSASGILVNL